MVEHPKLDIPNYDELERKWNFKKYDELIQKFPERGSTVASLLSACVKQVCEELRGDKSQESTIDDELELIFNDGFSQISTNLSYTSNKQSVKETFEEKKKRLITYFKPDPINFNNVKI